MDELEHAGQLPARAGLSLAGVPVHGEAGGVFALGMGAGREARSGKGPGGGVAVDLARMLGRAKAGGGESEGHAPGTLPLHSSGARGPLDVSHPGDAAEREAERIVDLLYPSGGTAVDAREREAGPAGGSAGASYNRGVFGGMADGGMGLPEATRHEMEAALGADLAGVRIHTDSNAAKLSESLGATAFTYGSDIFFDSGQFEPGTRDGKRLLAHELTHSLQQQQSGPTVARDGERKTTLQCVNENLSSAGVAAWVLAIVGTTCGLIGALAGSPTGPGAAATAAGAAAVCIAGVVGFSVGFVLGIITGCAQDPNFKSAGANPR
jgi:hypothetical protein